MNSKLMTTLILSVCMLVPVSVDIFISGLPEISQYFPDSNVALVLSMTLYGLAFSQLVYGPLLDRFGRRPVLIAGLGIFIIASFLIISTTSFKYLLIGRFLQSFGGCSGTVAAFAIARDSYDKEKMVYVIGTIMAMVGISPIISPLIGSYLNSFWGWKASFVFLLFMGIFYLFIIFAFFKETLVNKNKDALKMKHIFLNYITLAKIKGFLAFCFCSGFTYCILFSYLNISAFFIIKEMGFNLIDYGWIVAFNATAIILMAKISPHIVKKISFVKTSYIALFLIFVGGSSMILVNTYNQMNLYTFMLPMFIVMVGSGMIRPTTNAGAMQLSPKIISGSASALFNFISFGFGAIASTYSIRVIHNVVEFGIFVVLCALIAFLIINITFSKNFNTVTENN